MTINKKIRGLRDPIPQGYFLGRTAAGSGDTQLIPIAGFTTKGYVANTTVTNQLPSGDIFVGSAGGIAIPVAITGDITLSNAGVVAVTKIKGIALGAGAPSDGEVLTYVAANTDAEWVAPSASGGVLTGVGAPTALKTAGTLYSQTDTDAVWSSQPTAGSPSVVQHKSFIQGNTTPGSVTLDAAPTAGNLLLAFIPFGDNTAANPTINTGSWTQFITIAGTGSHIRGFAVYRYVQAGDTAALPAFCTAGSEYWAAAVYEINHVSGVFANDVPLSEGVGQTGSATQATTGQLTVNANDLALIAGGNYNGNANPTISAGWTSDESQHNASNFGSVVGGHQTVASPTTISGTLTFSNSADSVTAFQCVVANLGSLDAGWGLVGPPVAANPTAAIGAAAVNGTATTFMRSDAAPALPATLPALSGVNLTALNASNLGSGTVPAARMPAPTASTLGGVESLAAVTHNFLTSISTAGVPAQAQPAMADVSDYSTGTFTPTDASGAGLTFTQQAGGWTKIGNMVFASGTCLYPATVSALAAVLGSLPFTSRSTSPDYSATPNMASSGAGVNLVAKVGANTTAAFLINYNTGTSIPNSTMSGNRLYFNLVYTV